MWNYKLTLKFRARIKESFVTDDVKELMTTNLFFLFVRLIPDISKKAEATKGYHEIKSLNFQIM